MTDIMWWGYIHANGSVQVKRYFNRKDIAEVFYAEVVRAKRYELVTQSMRAYRTAKDVANTTSSFLTSEPDSRITPKDHIDNIPNKNNSDKNNSRYRKAEPSYKDHIGPKSIPKGKDYLSWFEKFVTNVFDSQYALKKLEQGLDLVGSLSGYKSMNMTSNFPSIFSNFLKHGTPVQSKF